MNRKVNYLIMLLSISIWAIVLCNLPFLNLSNSLTAAQTNEDLWTMGYALLPQPQNVELKGSNFSFGSDWRLELLSGVTEQHIATKTLLNRLNKEFRINLLKKSGYSLNEKVIQLEIKPGSAAQGVKEELSRQAYVLNINPTKITITGNSGPGLLYGVSTLMQLLISKGKNNLTLPVCRIEDWPELEQREIHWDSQYHQDRYETLKEYLDRAVEFKINGVGFSIKDKFAYERHPILAAPGAFTKKQIQELVRYAHERFIELTIHVQVPSHMSYVLKHPQFAHLSEDIINNFQICTSKEETWELIFDMFDEIMEATPGGRFFHVGTDESWFYGSGKNCGCAEKVKKIGKSGMFAESVNKVAKYLEERGREVRIWAEYPLMPKDILKIPNTVIDAVVNPGLFYDYEGENGPTIERRHGMRGMIYVSIHGGGSFFSDYIQRVKNTYKDISDVEMRKNKIIGTFIAAWDESAPHNEIFWLGWTAGTSYGWNSKAPLPDILVPKFMKLFYSPEVVNMQEVYRLMSNGAKFWSSSWGSIPTLKKLNYGGSYGPRPSPRKEPYIELPNLPDSETLYNHPFWKNHYKKNLEELEKQKNTNNYLLDLLNENHNRVSRNKYNVEVMLANAKYFRHNIDLLETLSLIEDTLSAASRMREYHRYEEAINYLKDAEQLAENICKDREETYENLKKVWEKSQYPKGRTVDGKKFVHIESNTWSGGGNRTPDLSHLVRRECRLNLEKWIYDLKAIRHTFTLKHQFDVPDELLYLK